MLLVNRFFKGGLEGIAIPLGGGLVLLSVQRRLGSGEAIDVSE